MAGNMSISQDEKERAVFRSRKMYQTDYESDIATAEDRGKKIGEEIGEKRGKKIGERNRNLEIARKMLSIGESPDKIMLLTDLTENEINSLRN